MKSNAGTKARPLGQPAVLCSPPAQKPVNPRRISQEQIQPSVPALFAEGVDVGVELALRWMEEELAHGERIEGSIQEALRSIRQQARHYSYLQQVLRTSPAPISCSRRIFTSARGRGTARSSSR